MSSQSDRSTRKALFIVVPFLSVFAVIGLVIAGYGASNWLEVDKVRAQWQTTRGRVLSSKLTYSHGEDSDTTGTSIRYQYTVAGRQYESDNVRVGADYSSSDSSEAEDAVRRFPAGAECTVHYNPSNPGESVLLAEHNTLMVIMLNMGLAFGCFGLLGLYGVLYAMSGNRRLGRAAGMLGKAGWDECDIGDVTIESGGGRLRILQRSHPLICTVGGAGLAAFLSIFAVGFLFAGLPADDKMRFTLWAVAVGAAICLVIGTTRRNVVFDESSGTLARTVKRLGWSWRRAWPLAEIEALTIVPGMQSKGNTNGMQKLVLKLRSTAGPPAVLISDSSGGQGLMVGGAILARAMGRRMTINESVRVEAVEAALNVIETMGLKDVLAVDRSAGEAPASMPEWMGLVKGRIEGAAKALGVPVDELNRRAEALPAASTTGDPLAQGRPAGEALATEGLFSRVGGLVRAVIPLVFGLMFAAFGLGFMFVICVAPAGEVLRAKAWPTTAGRVVEVDRKTQTGDGGGNDTYRPLVRYTYAVGGRQYEHDSPYLRPMSSSTTGWIEPVLARYRVGQEVMVHYDRADPARSALELRVPEFTIGMLGFTSIFPLVGVCLAVWSLRDVRGRRGFARLLARLLAGGLPLAGRIGRFWFEERGEVLNIIRRPSRMVPAVVAWVVLAPGLGIAMMLLSPGEAAEMAVAWGVPTAAALALAGYSRRVERRVSVVGTGAGRTVRSLRRGWLGEPHQAEWRAKDVEVLHVDAQRRESSSDSGKRVFYTPRLKLILSGGGDVTPLDCADNAQAVAVAAAALARSLGRPIWISEKLDARDQSALRRALDAQDYMHMARVIGDPPDTSWDERLGTRPGPDRAEQAP